MASCFTTSCGTRATQPTLGAPASRRVSVKPLQHRPLPQSACHNAPRVGRHIKPCRAEQHQGSSEAEGQDFYTLAKTVAQKLASDLSGQPETIGKISSWLENVEPESAGALRPEDRMEGEKQAGAGEEGLLSRLAHKAADVFKGQGPKSVSDAAAEYLGASSVAADSVKSWLTNPGSANERTSVKMVAALVHRLLQSLERNTGERFEGDERQYNSLYHLAREVLGGSLTKDIVVSLVKAYLRVAQ